MQADVGVGQGSGLLSRLVGFVHCSSYEAVRHQGRLSSWTPLFSPTWMMGQLLLSPAT